MLRNTNLQPDVVYNLQSPLKVVLSEKIVLTEIKTKLHTLKTK